MRWARSYHARARRFLTARHTCCNYAEKNAVLLNSYDDVHLWGGAEALPSTTLQAGPPEGLFVVKEVLTGLGSIVWNQELVLSVRDVNGPALRVHGKCGPART